MRPIALIVAKLSGQNAQLQLSQKSNDLANVRYWRKAPAARYARFPTLMVGRDVVSRPGGGWAKRPIINLPPQKIALGKALVANYNKLDSPRRPCQNTPAEEFAAASRPKRRRRSNRPGNSQAQETANGLNL